MKMIKVMGVVTNSESRNTDVRVHVEKESNSNKNMVPKAETITEALPLLAVLVDKTQGLTHEVKKYEWQQVSPTKIGRQVDISMNGT